MTKAHLKNILACLLWMAVCQGCKKFLDAKPDGSFDTLTSLDEFQAVLDHSNSNGRSSAAGEIGTDLYYVEDLNFNNQISYEKKIYLWQKTTEVTSDRSWAGQYNIINTANIVLNELPNAERMVGDEEEFNNIKGTALFLRAFHFHITSQIYTKPYNAATASTDLGLALRLEPDFKKVSVRGTLQETYDQILNDLKEASGLLPVVSFAKSRPSKPAAYAAIARVYMTMNKYDSAGKYADLSLGLYSRLTDFNTLSTTSNQPFPAPENNLEIMFTSYGSSSPGVTAPSVARIDSLLYKSYDSADLRRSIYFRANTGALAGTYAYKAELRGQSFGGNVFSGLLTDEMYFTRAECYARAGNIEAAMADLNALLKTRWNKNVPYIDFSATSAKEATGIILQERKKGLLFRGLRWMDLRRLSNDPDFAVTPKRIVNGVTYELPISAYTHQIPEYIIKLSGMQQNP
jgi:tetratricopeptide (TPR) repeat protein